MNRHEPFILFSGRDLSWSRSLRAELRHLGAQILTATTLSETLDVAARLHPDLVVLDDGVSPFDSAFLLRLVRHRAPQADIALVTPGPTAALERRRRAFGLVHVAPAPADAGEVGDAVVAWLRGRLARALDRGRETPKIILVDDDAAFLSSLDRLIRQRGYRALPFDDASEALQALRWTAPDMAIVDVMMPGIDGLEFTREIRGLHGNRLPVVLLTARSADADIVDGYRQGADFYLTKPCEPRDLLNVVDYLVGDLDERERRILQAQL